MKDKVITPKKKGAEKGSVDKKSSVFKVYDFDSSEDEPLNKTTEKKRVVSRLPSQAQQTGSDPIAAHFSNKIANKQSRNSLSVGKGSVRIGVGRISDFSHSIKYLARFIFPTTGHA